MKLIVGLGNPGRQYAETRHNVGWMALDRLADRAGWSGRARERDAAATARGRIGDLDVMLVKPLTFMNDSGVAVRKILARERVKLGDMLVVVDDFALPFGRLRIRPSGTAGGHNGLRSIIGELGSQDFARLRIGIGEPRRNAVDHVLSRFGADERRLLPGLLDAAADAVEAWAHEGAAQAANRWNAWVLEGTGGPVSSAGPAARIPSRPPGQGRTPGDAARADGPDAAPAVGASPRDSTEPSRGASRADTPAAAASPAASAAAAPGEVGGPPGPDGIRRTRTGWRRLLGDRGSQDEERR